MKKLLIGLSFLTLASNAFALSPTEIYSKSVKAILVLKSNGKPAGTGFFIGREGIILTNNHVIRGKSINTFEGTSINKNEYSKFEILYSDPNADIAVLKVAEIKENDTFLEMAGPEEKLIVGDDSYWIGHPDGLKDFTFSRGYLGKIDSKGLPDDLQLHGVGFHGSSGSPFLNNEGKVIGILCQGNRKKEIITLQSDYNGAKGDYYQDEEYEGVSFGHHKDTILKTLENAKSVNHFDPAVTNLNNNKNTLADYSSEKKYQIEPKNDLASLIRELKAYTPPEERKLGSL